MYLVLGRFVNRCLPILYIVSALCITLQVQPGNAQETRLLVGDGWKDGILVYDGETGAFRDSWGLSPTGGLSFPQGLIFGPDGHLYVSSTSTDSILRYDGQTGAFMDVFAATGRDEALESFWTLTFGPDNDLYVSSYRDSHSILRYDGQTGNFLGAFVVGGISPLVDPWELAFGPDNHLYVISRNTSSILRYDGQTGAFLGAFVASGSDDLDDPWDLTIGPDGHLYVCSYRTDSILRYDGRTGEFMGVLVPAGSGGLHRPAFLVFGPDDDLYVSSWDAGRILRYDGQTGAFLGVFVELGSGGLKRPGGLVFGPDGHLYVSSNETGRILRYDGQTGAFIDAFVAAGSGGLNRTSDLDFGPDDHLYVSSSSTHNILRYDGQTGAFIDTFVSFDQGGLTFPTGAVFQTLKQPSLPLSIEKDGDGRGEVFSSPAGIDCGVTCTDEFPDGTEITLTAVPEAEHVFVGWQGGGCSGTGPCTVTLTQPLTITATFEPQPSPDHALLTILRAGEGSGTVTSDSGMIDCGTVCTAEYAVGTSDTLRTTAAATSVFVGWGGEGCSGIAPCTVTLTQSQTLTAVFEPLPAPDTFALFVSKIGTGSGRVTANSGVIDCGSICGAEVTEGTSLTLNAMPDPNSIFMGWQGGGCAGVAACTFTMTQAHNITARFDRVPMPKTLTVQKRGTGRGTVSSVPEGIHCGVECEAEFPDNEVVTLSVEPASDSTFVGWVGGLCSGTDSCTVTMNDNRLITALINSEEPPEETPDEGPDDTL